MTPEKSSSAPRRVKRAPKKKAAAKASAKAKSTATALVDEEVVIRLPEQEAGPSKFAFLTRGTVRGSDVTIFLRQLIMLLEAGTPMLKSLKTLSLRGENAAVRALVADIMQYVENGNPLWQSFDRHPRYFDSVFVNLIKASEASGTLVTVLRRLTEYRERRQMLRKRVRGAMIYPVILIVACFGVLLLIAKMVVPAFAEMFKNQDIELAGFTKGFLDTSQWFADYFWIPLVIMFALVIVYQFWFVRNPARRLIADRIKIKIPIIGPIIHKNALVEMTRTLSMLLRSGLSMMATLDLTRNAIHNRAVGKVLLDMRNAIEEGSGLEAPLRASSGVIPGVVTDMMVTGEESGRVDEITEQIANVYDEEVKIHVSNLGESLQPIITIIIGIVVIMLFIALFMPMIEMMDKITSMNS